MKKLHTVIVVLALAAAGVGAWWVQNRPATGAGGPGGMAGAASAPASGAGARGPGGGGGPVAVEVGRVERMKLEDDALAVGSLRSAQSVMLRPEVSGRIVKLAFSDGQPVKRGQLLVQLDDALQQAQLLQAQAQASIARTNLQRSRELLAQNFVSQSAVDQNAAALEVAQAQVVLAQAQLARMKVLAPFDGLLGIRAVNLGDYVKDGADIVAVEDVSSLWVDFRLPERFLAKLKPGQAVDVSFDALAGQRFTARVAALDAQLDANGRSVLVRARLANPQGALRSGMFARTRTLFATRESALVVPEEALVPQGDKQLLFKLVPAAEGKGLVSRRVEARIGQRAAGKVEILAGVEEGDRVVLSGQTRLLRGDAVPVRVVDVSRAGQPGAGASGPRGAASAPRGGPSAPGMGAAGGAAAAARAP
ncbi:MAG: efflux RND transporter periplasmic adaptor subunit [Burkholderiaceae bacterium]|nr:efflux RND transporter periplasmic adaptor subunit [Burkholderiaceae bacterium]